MFYRQSGQLFLPFFILILCNFLWAGLGEAVCFFFGVPDGMVLQLVLSFGYAITASLILYFRYRKEFYVNHSDHPSRIQPDSCAALTVRKLSGIVLSSLGCFLAFSSALGGLALLFPDVFSRYNTSLNQLGFASLPASWVYAILFAPVCEELCFRGLTFSFAKKQMSVTRANLLQAFLFSLIHMNALQICYAFFLGLILGVICEKNGGMKYSLMFHILFNFYNLPVLCFYEHISDTGGLFFPTVFLAGSLLFLLSCHYFFTNQKKECSQ